MNGCVATTSLSRHEAMTSSECVPAPASSDVSSRRLAGSAHCMSSRNMTSGRFSRQNTCRKHWKTWLKRFCDSVGSSGASGGCGPMMRSSAGTTSVMTRPLRPTAATIASRHARVCAWLSVE